MLNPSEVHARARAGSVRRGSRLESGPHQGDHMLQSGDIAPAFSLPDADMEMFDLALVVGKQNVVYYLYLRVKTPGCTRQAADFSDHEDEIVRYDLIVL